MCYASNCASPKLHPGTTRVCFAHLAAVLQLISCRGEMCFVVVNRHEDSVEPATKRGRVVQDEPRERAAAGEEHLN